MGSQGFWSYVHADDDANNRRLSQLARDVVGEFGVLTGESFEMFLDKDAIKWGELWRDQIDTSLVAGAFFIPVITPRYFMSVECRRELQFFARKAVELGTKELVLPLLYVDVPALHEKGGTDDLVHLVGTFQWEDWRDTRFADPSTEHYRRAVSRLAARLVTVSRNSERAASALPPSTDGGSSGLDQQEDMPGFIDQMAVAEEAMPKLVKTVEGFSAEITRLGEIMTEGALETQRANEQKLGFSVRVAIARRVASQLSGPVDQLSKLTEEYSAHVHDVDQGMRPLILRAEPEVRENPETRPTVSGFLDIIRSFGSSAEQALTSAQRMDEITANLETLSKDLRPVARRLRAALVRMMEGYTVALEWARLAAEVELPAPAIKR